MEKKRGNLHFIGIGGSGMIPLAEIALSKGYSVSGSDILPSDTTDLLIKRGANVFFGHDSNNITDDLDTIIYSSAISKDNPEYIKGLKSKARLLHRSDLLNQFMKDHKNITVAGSHGKTTTTALISHMLTTLGHKPTTYLGAKTLPQKVSGSLGESPYFIAEADESDGSFLKYTPHINVLMGLGADHLDHYHSFDGILKAFKTFILSTDPEGTVILFWDDPHLRSLFLDLDYKNAFLSFGSKIGCDLRIYDYKPQGNLSHFTAVIERDLIKGIVPIPGIHNVTNAIASLGVARAIGLDIQQAAESFESFKGVERRMQLIYESENILIYDDYAHNPEKISSAISGIRASWPSYKLHIVFEPHRHSRMETLYNEIVCSFQDADFVYVLPIYSGGERASKNLSSNDIAKSIKKTSAVDVLACDSFEDAKKKILKMLSNKTIIISLGAGDVSKVSYELKKHFEDRKVK